MNLVQPTVPHVWDLITFIKFQAFPFTPDELKERVCKLITGINIYRPEFHNVIDGMFARNAFFEFDRFIRRYRRYNPGYFNTHQKDLEILMGIFWAEPNEDVARRLMRAFMIFPLLSDELRTVWDVAINVLYSKSSHDDTVAALTLLESYESRMIFDVGTVCDADYILIDCITPPSSSSHSPQPIPEPPTSEPFIAQQQEQKAEDDGSKEADVGSADIPERRNAFNDGCETAKAIATLLSNL